MNNIHEFLSKALEGASIDEIQTLILSGPGKNSPTQKLPEVPQPEEIKALLEDYFRQLPDAPACDPSGAE